ncbi:MAG: radical SAM protein, partial [Bifidobacteriaceae bacterium]|nr:radical SAM protein [Bifidobacteriaceae bacterium]
MTTSTTYHRPLSGRTAMQANHGKYMVVLYTKPADCGGVCTYCIRTKGVTRSTIANDDTLMAQRHRWLPSPQFHERLAKEKLTLGHGHKFELRIKGNSFTNYDPGYLSDYIRSIYDILNGRPSVDFDDSFGGQLDAPDRCVQIVVETRPDLISEEWCRTMSRWGVTTVEIGVQSLLDSVLDRNRRGHGVDAVIRASRLIRLHGFELGYQVMVGLVGASRDDDAEMLARTLWRPEFYPDTLKIYPCIAVTDPTAQRPLRSECRSGAWKPYGDDEYSRLILTVAPHFPRDVHVNRLQRIMEPSEIALGPRAVLDRRTHAGLSSEMWQRSIQQVGANIERDYSVYSIAEYQHESEVCLQALSPDDVLFGYSRVSLNPPVAVLRDLRVLGP